MSSLSKILASSQIFQGHNEDVGEARNCNPMVSSQALYHCATSLPVIFAVQGF